MNRNLILFAFVVLAGTTAQAQQDTIADQRLTEVVVTAKLPLVEMSAGRTTYRMDASITQSIGNLYDVLSSLPGVTVDANGGITMNGKTGVQVLIDGKSTYLSGMELVTLLKSTPATGTDKIDLITQPSARYEAAGNIGMIDIRMRKIKLRGVNFSLYGNGSLGRAGSGYLGTSMNWRRDKFNFFLTYSYYWGKNIVDMTIDRPYMNNAYRMWQDSYRRRFQHSNFLRTGCDFYVNESTEWGVGFRGNFWGQKENSDMLNAVHEVGLHSWTYSHEDNHWNDFTVGTNFTHRLRRKGGELSASADYFYYDRRRNQHMHCVETDTLKGNTMGRINIFAVQADLVYPLSDNWRLQTGAKMAFVRVDNRAGYLRPSPSGWQTDGTLGSHFVYDENINGAYLQADYKLRRLEMSIGLRLEHTHVHGELSENVSQPDSSFASGYANLFPTASLQYKFDKSNTVQLSYGRRITRPNYGDLNPFVYIFDAYTSEGGNTHLHASFTDNVELAYLYRDYWQGVLFFSRTGDAIVKGYQIRAGEAIFVTPQNLSTYYQTGIRLHAADLSITSWWKANLTLIGMYNYYHWNDAGTEVKNHRLSPIIGMMNQITMASTWSAELAVNYTGKMAYGQATVHPVLEVNIGVQKKVLKGKGSISLFIKDLFNTKYEKIDMPIADGHAYASSDFKQRVLGIAFSWRFQKGSEVKERKQKVGIDEMKRVNL